MTNRSRLRLLWLPAFRPTTPISKVLVPMPTGAAFSLIPQLSEQSARLNSDLSIFKKGTGSVCRACPPFVFACEFCNLEGTLEAIEFRASSPFCIGSMNLT